MNLTLYHVSDIITQRKELFQMMTLKYSILTVCS